MPVAKAEPALLASVLGVVSARSPD